MWASRPRSSPNNRGGTTEVERWGRRPNPIWISQMVDLEAGGELVTYNWALWLKV